MNFFDKLTKKTNEAYQSAKEKTVKLSGEIKLKNKISDFKDKINTEYQEIGKLVYEKINIGEEPSKEDITPKCEEIARLKSEIEKAEAEILALKDIKKCFNCGAELSFEDGFCSQCGKEQPKVEKVEITEEPTAEAENVEVTNVKTVEQNEQESNEESNVQENVETSTEENTVE